MNRHTQALAEHLIGRGNEVRVLAPWDPPDRLSRTLHRGASPRVRPLPDYLIPLGRTVGFGANGAVSNLSVFPDAITPHAARAARRAASTSSTSTSRRRRRSAGTHARSAGAPVVGTFHAYAPKFVPNNIAVGLGARRKFNQLQRPDRRLRGGGVDRQALVRRQLRDRSPTGSTSTLAPERPSARRSTESCGCCSSAAPRSARACRSCSAPSRRSPSTFPPGSSSSAPRRRRSSRSARRPRGRSSSIDALGGGRPRPALARSSRPPTCSARPRSRARASGWS